MSHAAGRGVWIWGGRADKRLDEGSRAGGASVRPSISRRTWVAAARWQHGHRAVVTGSCPHGPPVRQHVQLHLNGKQRSQPRLLPPTARRRNSNTGSLTNASASAAATLDTSSTAAGRTSIAPNMAIICSLRRPVRQPFARPSHELGPMTERAGGALSVIPNAGAPRCPGMTPERGHAHGGSIPAASVDQAGRHSAQRPSAAPPTTRHGRAAPAVVNS